MLDTKAVIGRGNTASFRQMPAITKRARVGAQSFRASMAPAHVRKHVDHSSCAAPVVATFRFTRNKSPNGTLHCFSPLVFIGFLNNSDNGSPFQRSPNSIRQTSFSI